MSSVTFPKKNLEKPQNPNWASTQSRAHGFNSSGRAGFTNHARRAIPLTAQYPWRPEAFLETSLYLPVKRFLEQLGFSVKGEIGHCDLVALSPG